mmetsp:Transcript_69069/g.138891  ORF Transcript_69069/g.138891 Transcript_69069/m.138891 type:complete len:253 (-) Transcript_69069:1076-1834(-)
MPRCMRKLLLQSVVPAVAVGQPRSSATARAELVRTGLRLQRHGQTQHVPSTGTHPGANPGTNPGASVGRRVGVDDSAEGSLHFRAHGGQRRWHARKHMTAASAATAAKEEGPTPTGGGGGSTRVRTRNNRSPGDRLRKLCHCEGGGRAGVVVLVLVGVVGGSRGGGGSGGERQGRRSFHCAPKHEAAVIAAGHHALAGHTQASHRAVVALQHCGLRAALPPVPLHALPLRVPPPPAHTVNEPPPVWWRRRRQ